MSLRRPFVAPRSTSSKLTTTKTMLVDSNDEMTSSKKVTMSNTEGYDQTPMNEWVVSEDEDDSVPISQIIEADKAKGRPQRKKAAEKKKEREIRQIEKRQQAVTDTSSSNVIPFKAGIPSMSYREALEVGTYGEVMRWSDEEKTYPLLFEKGHSNRGRDVARFFGTVCHVGYVTEVIPRRNGFYYKVTYEDGDQEDMDEPELLYAIELKVRKNKGEDISNEAEVVSDICEEGSVYDSEDDRQALRESKKKRKSLVALSAAGSTKKNKKAANRTVFPESIANDGGAQSVPEKTISR
jgi:hypothetical protein